jgi:predicted Zn-dependent peptidase
MKRATILTIFVLLAATLFAGNTGSFKLPPYSKFQLKNGMTVYLMEQHEVPLVHVITAFPAGAVKDGKKSGLANLTAEALLFGTKTYTKDQIQESLDFLGATYYSAAGTEVAEVGMSFAAADTDKILPVLKSIITEPVFDKKEFEKRKKRMLVELMQDREVPRRVIGTYFKKFLFGNHPYGNPVSGTQASVKAIALDDIKSFYRDNYKPADSVIAIVGDFKTAAMKKKIAKLLKGWNPKGTSTAVDTKADLPKFDGNRLLLVNKGDATETQFLIGHFGILYNNPDYIGVQVLNTILGGRFTSWLMQELRVKAGLTYGARSRFTTYSNAGTFYITSYTRTAKTEAAIDLALKVLDRLHSEGIDEETLVSAKNYMKGQYPPRYETSERLANLLTDMFFYNYDESFINDFQKNVEGLTLGKTKELIKKYFSKDNLQFVLIGKADAIRDTVKKYGAVTEKEIKADEF